MKISAVIVCLALAVGSAANAQDQTVKIVRVNGTATDFVALACPSAPVICRPNDALRAIVLRGKQVDIDSTERAIKELDELSPTSARTANKNVETSVYVIAGINEPNAGGQDISGEPLVPVVKQIRAIFPYTHYQLMSSMMLRSSNESGVMSTGLMRSLNVPTDTGQPSKYAIKYDAVKSSTEQTGAIHFKNFEFRATVPHAIGNLKSKEGSYITTQYQNSDIIVAADLDIHEGQKVVVGKANVSDSDTCFFVVVSARLVP